MIKPEVLENMSKYGGSFVKTLSLLYRQADRLNIIKLEEMIEHEDKVICNNCNYVESTR